MFCIKGLCLIKTTTILQIRQHFFVLHLGIKKANAFALAFLILVLVRGFEPPLGCPNEILSLARLPFRHTSMFIDLTILAYIFKKIKHFKKIFQAINKHKKNLTLCFVRFSFNYSLISTGKPMCLVQIDEMISHIALMPTNE